MMNSKIPVEKITSHFNLGEIIYLCHDLDINFEDLDGNTLTLKTVSLIEYCQRHEKIDDLRVHLQNLRPNVIWGNNDVEITNFSQPQFEITLVFDKAGSLIGDRPELIADLVELLYAVQNKEAVKLAVKYTEISIIEQQIQSFQNKTLTPTERVWNVDLNRQAKRYQEKVVVVKGAINYLFFAPILDSFRSAHDLLQSIEGIGQIIFDGIYIPSNSIALDIYRVTPPKIGAKIWLGDDEIKHVENLLGYSIFKVGSDDLYTLSPDTRFSKAIPTIVLEISNKSQFLTEKKYDLNNALNLDAWKFGLG